MFPQYGELSPINGWDLLASLGHPSKFQRVSRLAFVTAATSLTGNEPNFARCLAVSWAATLYIHFWRLLSLTEFCPVQNWVYVQVLRSGILAVLLHGTPAAGVSQTLWSGTKNGITELSQTAPPIFDRAAITLGIGPHSSYFLAYASIRCHVRGLCPVASCSFLGMNMYLAKLYSGCKAAKIDNKLLQNMWARDKHITRSSPTHRRPSTAPSILH